MLVGDQSDQKLALQNIASMVRPGGILIIDHRNYDYILETGRAPKGKNIYYKVLNLMELRTVTEFSVWHVDDHFVTHLTSFSVHKFLIYQQLRSQSV